MVLEHVEKAARRLKLDRFENMEHVQLISEKTHVKPILIVFVAFIIIAGFAIGTAFGRVMIESLLVFFYPAFKSFQALKTEESYDDRRMLTYWVVFGFFYGFDASLSFIFHSIPFWPLVRVAILLYIMHPKYRGADLVFENVIKPILDRYDEQLERFLDNAQDKVKKFSDKAKQATAETISKNLLKTKEE